MSHRYIVMSVLVIGFTTCQAEVSELEPSRDTTIYEDDDSLSNGNGSYLFSGATASKNSQLVRRALIGFDLLSIPGDATILEVSLELRVNKTPPRAPSSSDMSLHRLTKIFGEGASDAGGQEGKGTSALKGDATWADAILNDVSWDEPGGDFVSAASAVTGVGGPGRYTWGSTDAMVSDVQLWLDNPEMNFGWILIGDESTDRTAKRFDSVKTSREGNRPTLTVSFELNSLLGDCNGDDVVTVADLDCLATIKDRDAALAALNTLPGDLDGKDGVAFADFLVLSGNFGQLGLGYRDGNIDLKDDVAFADFLILSGNFGQSPEQAASLASVPEPSSIQLLTLALLYAVCVTRKRS